MRVLSLLCAFSLFVSSLSAQPYGEPDRGQPGDEMIQEYLAKEALRLDAQFKDDCKSLEIWQANRERYREEYLYMLGLSPLPEKTDLKATVTGTLERDGYVVEKLHYQSVPGLYVTANLYRPANAESRQRFPAVLYVCGHANRGRDGNKTAYQAHPIWLAKHGFICLIVDTLEFGEINDHPRFIHHGTYNLERWWWHSRGYTPAGVECWNGVRGIDYLLSRADVDPNKLGVTGISGGGAATFWIAAADERIKVAIPVSGMADLESYVGNRVINGHCDCMFLYNTFQWPWTRIAGLIAPRPMLFINSDNDRIFPMDANERVTNRMERLYSLYGASDKFDTVVSVGGHAYREDIRRAAFAFLQYHLQGKADPITDSEVDLVDESTKPPTHPIPTEELRVFPTDDDIPKDALNITIDEHFVPIAKPELPKGGEYEAWKKSLLTELRRVVFRPLKNGANASLATHYKEPWTRKNPPNYVERSFALLGQTASIARMNHYMHHWSKDNQASGSIVPENAGIKYAYSQILLSDVTGSLVLEDPPTTHMDPAAPQFLNILRVCDVPDMLGLLAPRPLKIVTKQPDAFERTRRIYEAAGASDALVIQTSGK